MREGEEGVPFSRSVLIVVAILYLGPTMRRRGVSLSPSLTLTPRRP